MKLSIDPVNRPVSGALFSSGLNEAPDRAMLLFWAQKSIQISAASLRMGITPPVL
jgi:hypothetical protein